MFLYPQYIEYREGFLKKEKKKKEKTYARNSLFYKVGQYKCCQYTLIDGKNDQLLKRYFYLSRFNILFLTQNFNLNKEFQENESAVFK